MKLKLLIPLGILLLTAQAAFSQFHLGIKGGANISKVNGKSYNDEFRYGYHLGGFAEIRFKGTKFGLQPEVVFSQVNSTLDSNYKALYQNVFASGQNIKLKYLSMPLLLSYKLIGNVLSLQAGPQIGILIDRSRSLVQNGAEAFKKGDLSMVGGVQIKLSDLRLSGRYTIGLNNISEIDNQDKWRNQGFQVSVGYAF